MVRNPLVLIDRYALRAADGLVQLAWDELELERIQLVRASYLALVVGEVMASLRDRAFVSSALVLLLYLASFQLVEEVRAKIFDRRTRRALDEINRARKLQVFIRIFISFLLILGALRPPHSPHDLVAPVILWYWYICYSLDSTGPPKRRVKSALEKLTALKFAYG